jgi:hypothetical protein
MPRKISKTLKEADSFQDTVEWYSLDIKNNDKYPSNFWIMNEIKVKMPVNLWTRELQVFFDHII